MLFEASITIPKSTTQDDPTEVILKIAHGIITKIMVLTNERNCVIMRE